MTVVEGFRRRARTYGGTVNFAPAAISSARRPTASPGAVEAAKASDLVVAVLGEPQELSGEAASRAHLTFINKQPQLLDALIAAGKPIVLLIVAGRPVELGRFAEKVPAIMMAWFPGTEAGPALADVVFGDVGPSGRLPVSYPRTVGQLPLYYNRLPTGRPTRDNRFTLGYMDESVTPLYPFGYGLSYTRFAYSDVSIAKTKLEPGEVVEVGVTLANTGARAGQEVAALCPRSGGEPLAAGARTQGLRKVALEPGESGRITLRVPVERSASMATTAPISWRPARSSSSSAARRWRPPAGSIEIVGDLHVLPGERKAAKRGSLN